MSGENIPDIIQMFLTYHHSLRGAAIAKTLKCVQSAQACAVYLAL